MKSAIKHYYLSTVRHSSDMTAAERKTEALSILTNEPLTHEQIVRLNALTSYQVAGGYGNLKAWTQSVDTCLTLPIPGKTITLHPTWGVQLHANEGYYEPVLSIHRLPLPLAMIEAYWRCVEGE